MGKMMIPRTANLLRRGEPDNPITTHSFSSFWKSSTSPDDDRASTSVPPPLHNSRDQLRHSAGGRRCGGGLGLTEESAAADLTSELTQLGLSDNTRNLNVILVSIERISISSFLIRKGKSLLMLPKFAFCPAMLFLLTHNMAKVKRILR